MPDDLCFENCITISTRHNTRPCEAFWHPYAFSAVSGHALVFRPIDALLAHPPAILYLCEAITAHNAWRYNYARTPKLDELNVSLPATKDCLPDIDAMAAIVRRQLS